MNALLIYPQYPETFWSFKHALKFISKKAAIPPLGLLTIASMMPADWNKKLIDLNVSSLKDSDLAWADMVFISAMVIQRVSTEEVIARAQALGKKVVAGGPLFTEEPDNYEYVDHLVLDEGEVTFPQFLDDLKKGEPKHLYRSRQHPDLSLTPPPMWSLIKFKNYATMAIQYSRGCPYNCDFCDIVVLFGHRPRTKTKEQVIRELDLLYQLGWRDAVFFVDDNFIGNKKKLKEEILPAIRDWMIYRNRPFTLNTEVSINLAKDDELLQLMIDAGFRKVFVGIETPNPESLKEAHKLQNANLDLVAAIKKLQAAGMEVQGGFIVGFDSDPPTIFDDQINFIQKSGILTAMVGLLNAPRGTPLYLRLKSEHRLIGDISGDNLDFSTNFIPKINFDKLIAGYKHVLETIYSPREYYDRLKTYLNTYRLPKIDHLTFHFFYVKALLRSFWVLGIKCQSRRYFWKILGWSFLKNPKLIPVAVTQWIYGYHFRKILKKNESLKLPKLPEAFGSKLASDQV